MESLNRFLGRIDELTLRERAIVFGGLITLLFVGWYVWLMEPLMKEEKVLTAELEARRQQFAELNEQFTKLAENRRLDPNAARRTRLAALREEEKSLSEQLQGATADLVTPELMPDLLRAVLKSSSGLHLVRLTGLGSQPLVEPLAEGARQGGTPKNEGGKPAGEDVLEGAYRHGLRIEFQGDYFSTLDYLHRLEGLEWQFFWDNLHFSVSEYPRATTSIEVFTLSLSRDWIGT
jgi:MSHA biogenesis protein MshJ